MNLKCHNKKRKNEIIQNLTNKIYFPILSKQKAKELKTEKSQSNKKKQMKYFSKQTMKIQENKNNNSSRKLSQKT
jgi:hypothetical protein